MSFYAIKNKRIIDAVHACQISCQTVCFKGCQVGIVTFNLFIGLKAYSSWSLAFRTLVTFAPPEFGIFASILTPVLNPSVFRTLSTAAAAKPAKKDAKAPVSVIHALKCIVISVPLQNISILHKSLCVSALLERAHG